MKRNITINFHGILYSIDEDAYQLLNNYIENIKRYFSKKEDGDEIANDIECRISELLAEMKRGGANVVTIENVQEIIKRVGSPEEVDEDTDSETRHDGETKGYSHLHEYLHSLGKRHLYRDTENSIAGGVLSGMSCFLGIDAVWLRLAAILLTFTYAIGFIVYLVLWIIVPPAVTTEEKLKMHGKEVNISNISDEVLLNSGSKKEETEQQISENRGAAGINVVFNIVAVLLKCLIIFMFAVIAGSATLLLIGAVITALCMFLSINTSGSHWNIPKGVSIVFESLYNNPIFWVMLGIVVVSSVLVFVLVMLITKGLLSNKSKSMSITLYGVGMFFAILLNACSLFVIIALVNDAHSKYNDAERVEYKQNMIEKQKKWLADTGWNIICDENKQDWYVKNGEHWSGDYSRKYIDAKSAHPEMNYQVERLIHVAPGTYRLEATGRTDGNGAGIYVENGGNRYEAAIPVCGNRGGQIWDDAKQNLYATADDKEKQRLGKIIAQNDSCGYGWSEVVIDNIVVNDSIVRYGVGNRCISSDVWNGTYFSAADFKLTKIK